VQWTDINIAQLKQQQEQQFAQLKQQQEQQFAQTQQQIVHLDQSVSHLVQLVQTFLRGNPGANYVQASNPSVEFHEPSEAFNDSRGAFEPRMNSSSPGANRLSLDPASSTERITRAPGQSSAKSLPTLPVHDYMTHIQYQITEEKGFFHNNISINLPPTTSSPTFLSRPELILQGDIKQIPNPVAETSSLFDQEFQAPKNRPFATLTACH